MPSNVAICFTEDSRGDIWIGTYGAGLLRLDGDEMRGIEKSEFLRDDSIHAIFEDRDGSLWIGTTNGGVCRLRDRYRRLRRRTRNRPRGRSAPYLTICHSLSLRQFEE